MKQDYACDSFVYVGQDGLSEGEFTEISTGPTRRQILLQQLEEHRIYVLQRRAEEDEIRRKAAEEEKRKYEQRLNILRKELGRSRIRKQQFSKADSKAHEDCDAVQHPEQNTVAPSILPTLYSRNFFPRIYKHFALFQSRNLSLKKRTQHDTQRETPYSLRIIFSFCRCSFFLDSFFFAGSLSAVLVTTSSFSVSDSSM